MSINTDLFIFLKIFPHSQEAQDVENSLFQFKSK